MRQCLVFGALLAATLAACGGSSSETPPPLQPDPKGFRYSGTPVTPAGEAAAEVADAGPPLLADPDDDPKPGKGAPAPGTWGGGKAAH